MVWSTRVPAANTTPGHSPRHFAARSCRIGPIFGQDWPRRRVRPVRDRLQALAEGDLGRARGARRPGRLPALRVPQASRRRLPLPAVPRRARRGARRFSPFSRSRGGPSARRCAELRTSAVTSATQRRARACMRDGTPPGRPLRADPQRKKGRHEGVPYRSLGGSAARAEPPAGVVTGGPGYRPACAARCSRCSRSASAGKPGRRCCTGRRSRP